MADFYADENFDYEVVRRLRMHGPDVLTVQEAGQRDQDDPDVLAVATAAKRAVLTFNRRDFIRLHKLTAAHASIVVCTNKAIGFVSPYAMISENSPALSANERTGMS